MFIFKGYYCLKISKLNKVFLTIILFLSYPNLSSASGISSVSYIEPIPLQHMPLRTGFTPILPTESENALDGIEQMCRQDLCLLEPALNQSFLLKAIKYIIIRYMFL